jgi:hypothetical protein
MHRKKEAQVESEVAVVDCKEFLMGGCATAPELNALEYFNFDGLE